MEQTWSWLQMGSSSDYRTHQQNGQDRNLSLQRGTHWPVRNRTGRHLEVAR